MFNTLLFQINTTYKLCTLDCKLLVVRYNLQLTTQCTKVTPYIFFLWIRKVKPESLFRTEQCIWVRLEHNDNDSLINTHSSSRWTRRSRCRDKGVTFRSTHEHCLNVYQRAALFFCCRTLFLLPVSVPLNQYLVYFMINWLFILFHRVNDGWFEWPVFQELNYHTSINSGLASHKVNIYR